MTLSRIPCADVRFSAFTAGEMGFLGLSEEGEEELGLHVWIKTQLYDCVRYHEAIKERKPLQDVHALLSDAEGELEQDFVAYRKDLIAGGGMGNS